MSWCCGSQLTATGRPVTAPALAMTLAWLTITPLGSLVDPEVYCRKSTRPGVSATGAPPKSRVPSVATQRQLRKPLGVRPWHCALSVTEQQAEVVLELLGRQHRLGLAIPRDEAELGQPRFERHGQRGADRYGDHPDARAGVERGHHLQAGRVDQQRAIPRLESGLGGQVGRQLARPLGETLVGVTLELPALGIDEPEEGLVRYPGFPLVQIINERLHRRSHPLPGSL